MSDRERLLLKEIVENYISCAKPIGSKSLCKKFKCSYKYIYRQTYQEHSERWKNSSVIQVRWGRLHSW